MAKNYILEPTEIDMTLSGLILFSDSFSFDLELDFTNSFLQVGNLVLRWNRTDTSNGWQLVEFTPNGDDNYEGGDPIGTLTNNPSPSMHPIEISWMPGGTPELLPSGTYTVSIYTETEDPDYPTKNTNYELYAHNDIERIRHILPNMKSSGGSNVVVINSIHQLSFGKDMYVLDMTYADIFEAANSGAMLVVCNHKSSQFTYEFVTSVRNGTGYIVETISSRESEPIYRSYTAKNQDDYPVYYTIS